MQRTRGRNRLCGCGYEVGTERSDCIWPQAVFLDPLQVLAVSSDGRTKRCSRRRGEGKLTEGVVLRPPRFFGAIPFL
jgi:hypothetical protein